MDNPAQMTDMEVRERVIKLEAIIRGRDELINNAVSSRIAELEKTCKSRSDTIIEYSNKIAELEKERDSLLRLIGYVKSIVFSKVECSYASFKRPLEELLKEKEGGS